jgi:hypothetical protein
VAVKIDIVDIKAFCRRREVDLVLSHPDAGTMIRLQAEFDSYGDFFAILAKEVAYVELPASFVVRDLDLTTSPEAFSPKWSHISRLYPGQALVMCSASADSFATAGPADLFILVADEIVFTQGRDWGH